jgi:transcription termination factor Rho
VTDTTALEAAPARRSGSLTTMKVAELQGLASSMGIGGTAKMRKGDLVEAIKARQGGRGAGAARTPEEKTVVEAPVAERRERSSRVDRAQRGERTEGTEDSNGAAHTDRSDSTGRSDRSGSGSDHGDRGGNEHGDRDGGQRQERDQAPRRASRDQQAGQREERSDRQDNRQPQQRQQQGQDGQQGNRWNDDEDGGRSGRRRRNRNRNRDKRVQGGQPDPGQQGGQEVSIAEDDVLVPVAGIVDILDNYAFIRTTGYLPGPNDIYVPLNTAKRAGLRKGDAVTGAIKAPREGEEPQQQTVGGRNNRQKYTAIARLDTINGMSHEDARKRPEFGKLTPLYPQERLRLETEPNLLTTRVIDLVAPIGKGQRGLLVAPPKAGKTLILQAIANAITINNPEVHLMVVLVDERPEEVTDMQRAVKGEVIASTFDRPADDHTTVAELAIERAKRLVEMGHDVVVLLDSITRLGRAYNLAAPASGRILSGGVDSAALYPPKRSSVPPATSRTVARSPSSPPRSSRPAPRWTRSSSRSSRAPATWSSSSTAAGKPSHLPGRRRQQLEHPPRGDPPRARRAQDHVEAPSGPCGPGAAGRHRAAPRSPSQDQDELRVPRPGPADEQHQTRRRGRCLILDRPRNRRWRPVSSMPPGQN